MEDSVFSKKIKGGFVDVRKAKNGNRYLIITKSKKVDGEWQRDRILIWGEDIPELFQTLKEAAPHLKD